MEIYPIRTEADYQAASKEVESLFDAPPNTPEYDRLDILSTLLEAYEKVHYPIEAPDPIDRFSIEQDIYAFKQGIRLHRQALNDEAVWLFLSTLGCWSVTNKTLQPLAYALALFLFVHRMKLRSKEDQSAEEIVQQLEKRIGSAPLEEDVKKALKGDNASTKLAA
jgi:hypothetical protein